MTRLARFVLCAICFTMVGCGKDDAEGAARPEANEVKQGPLDAELVLEASEPKLTVKGESVDAMTVVETILAENDELLPPAFHAQFDRDFNRQGQRLIWITMNNPFTPSQSALDEAADDLFAAIKNKFDYAAKQSVIEELSNQQAIAKAATDEVKKLQRTLQAFQESRRGLQQTSESRLERRQLERQIETTLQAQIDSNKRVESLQKRIDRERFVTLLRVR